MGFVVKVLIAMYSSMNGQRVDLTLEGFKSLLGMQGMWPPHIIILFSFLLRYPSRAPF